TFLKLVFVFEGNVLERGGGRHDEIKSPKIVFLERCTKETACGHCLRRIFDILRRFACRRSRLRAEPSELRSHSGDGAFPTAEYSHRAMHAPPEPSLRCLEIIK